MALSWTVAKVGTGDIIDKRAALRLIREENAKRTAQNVILAQQTPPGTPIAMLPFANNAQIEASAEIIMGAKNTNWWSSYRSESSRPEALRDRLTEAENAAMVAATIDRLDAGATPAALTADIGTP